MIPLLLSVLSSSLIFVIFKLFVRFKVNTFQAIVFNYFAAFILGLTLYQSEYSSEIWTQLNWLYYATGISILFIGLFFVMARSSQENGVASTSVAVKMSMAVSLIMMIIAYKENVPLLKYAGIALAFLGVYLVSSSKNSKKNNAAWMLILLFIGSGILDFLLSFVMDNQLGLMPPSLFAAFALGFAGITGFLILISQLLLKKTKLEFKNILAGLILGIPNYFSIYLLMLSYKSTGWNQTTVLAVTNVSVVVLSAMIGFTLFKEKAGVRKILGLICALLAILTLYIVNQNSIV